MAVPLTENFESYSVGDLGGQGGWTYATTGTGYFNVSTQTPYTGSQCVKASNVPNKMIYKACTNVLATATQLWDMNLTQTPATGDAYGVTFYHATPGLDPSLGYVFRVICNPTSSSAYNIAVHPIGGSDTNISTGLTVGNTWHTLQCDWDNSVPNVKVTVDGGNSQTISLASFTDISYIALWESGDPNDQFLVDDFRGASVATVFVPTLNLMGVGT